MILKCRECDEPMTETQKGRPENLPPTVKWIVCRQCDKGVEVIGDDVPDESNVKSLSYQEDVTVTHYIKIITSSKGTKKYTYADKEHKDLIKEEELA